jgi:hypothetical protein
MIRSIKLATFLVIGLVSTSTFSLQPLELKPNMSIDYDIPDGETKSIENFMFWEIKGNCYFINKDGDKKAVQSDISKTNQMVTLAATGATSKKVTVNNSIVLTKGVSEEMELQQHQNISIAAESGAKFTLTNKSGYNILAICATA